jgi:hypothetical protein
MKRERLKKKQPRTGLRKLIETHVISNNSRLTKVVQYMTTDVLLANCHPLDRKAFAFELKQEGSLDENLIKEYGL